MLKFFNRSLTAKVLTVLGAIVVISFTILCLTILSRQGSLLQEMGSSVNAKLIDTSENAEHEFTALENEVTTSLQTMGEQASASLLGVTERALSQEEKNVSSGMRKLLEANAESVASLIASVGTDSIMAKDFDQLTELSRAGAKTDEILFIFFLGKKEEPLPSYINRVDETIGSYLENFTAQASSDLQEEAQETLEILEKAQADPGVYIHRRPIEYYGLKVGTIVIGISQKTVAEEIAAMATRFNTLKQENESSIKKVLSGESAKVVSQIKNNLSQVQQGNLAALNETTDILHTSAVDVKHSTTNVVLIVGALCSLAIMLIFTFLLRAIVIKPIQDISDGLQDAAEGDGDLTKRLNLTREDEIGSLADWFDAFVERLNNIIVEIGGNSETVTSSALEVLSAAESLKNESNDLSMKANTVAAASEEMNTSMTSVAAASEQAATNISMVAGTAIEMKGALEDVVESCDQAMESSQNATAQVQRATENVSLLGDAARDITKVTEVITEIADQTNLLALNATIEAARAGEAGKGFAVVAGEIKSLAQQTQEATQEIKDKIEGIQNSTANTVSKVEQINGVIGEVDGIIGSIATSMSQQSERAAEVATNIEQASMGIAEVNENVAQSSQVSAEIAADIGEVSGIAQEMNGRSNTMRSSSEDLSELAGQLRNMISVFKVSEAKGKEAAAGAAISRDIISWNSAFSIGLSDIDDQHKKLVFLVNQLFRAMKTKTGSAESGRILTELTQYTVDHFAYEEKLFAKYGYPEAAKHKKLHTELIDKVKAFQAEYSSGRAGLSMDLMYFLTDWLKKHIMQSDKSYAPYLQSKMS